ncbi:hypothetical protein [Candidatus Enterovibrio escicola]|uniref:hypothetical protein n=1 Tax=Candidatus Enterovibrio escicola TaxID=1927127 RepID=UPI00123831AD|nr:hypothetical protein [Candidatus Enterovibrio escacola]
MNIGLIDANLLAKINTAFADPKKKNMTSISPNKLPTIMRSLTRASISHITNLICAYEMN